MMFRSLALGFSPETLFLLDAIEWLKYLVAFFFFSLGLFAGWWQWRYRKLLLRISVPQPETPPPLRLAPPDAIGAAHCAPAEELRSDGHTAVGESVNEEPVEALDPFGRIYPTAPEQVDELERIRGIGSASRTRLNGLGIYQFEQIANWGASEIAAVSRRLNLGEQIDRFGWVEQAKRLEKASDTKVD